MAHTPTVAIIGKPNSGKSTLFNRLVGRRKAIVSDTPGTTRDHIASTVQGDALEYLLIDTGGMGGGTEDKDLEDNVHRQSLLALEHADLILFTVSSREDLTASDMNIVDVLRKQKKTHVPVVLVVTKCDNPEEIDSILPQFYQLDIAKNIVAISAPHKIGMDDLERQIEENLLELKFAKTKKEKVSTPKVAIIGKPNVGKSSLVNAFMSETQRKKSPLLVSDIAGTTRDTTDTTIRYEGKEYIFMDTAGIKKRNQTKTDIETHAYFRSVRAVEMCDIAILVVDATEPISKQDKRIAGMIVEEGKGLIILLNKCDTLQGKEKEKRIEEVQKALAFCTFAPVLPCSAKTRTGLLKIFESIEMVQRNRTRRIATKELHRWFKDAVYNQPMSAINRSKHITQAEGLPPTFVVFVSDPKKVQVSQLRFLDNRLRKTFGFEGTPVRWVTKNS